MTQSQKEKLSIYPSKIKEWPADDRPREKLLKHGPTVLTDAELMALLIGSGTGGMTAVDLAKKLLMEHDDLNTLASAGIVPIMRLKGIGPACAARLAAAFEMGRRVESGKQPKKIKVRAPLDIARKFIPEFRGIKKELFKVVLLDNGNHIIRDVLITQGTLNASIVHPREIFKAAVDYTAAGIILMHNHPSGETTPSQEDRRVTEQLIEAGKVIGIPVLDHIIIADNQYYSFAQTGLI